MRPRADWTDRGGAEVAGSDDVNVQSWQAAAAEYLWPRLPADAFEFFTAVDVHDAELMSLEVRDGSRPAPRSGLARAWRSPLSDPVSVHLSVLNAEERILWSLRYTSVRRAGRRPHRRPTFLRRPLGVWRLALP